MDMEYCPFAHCIVDGFLKESDYDVVHSALQNASYQHRASDLFNFKQSKELKSHSSKVFDLLQASYFTDEFISRLESTCGRRLQRKFDTSFQMYSCNDYLLPHDDQLEQRAFAYVIYAVDDCWSPSCGGSLALLDCDLNVNPRRVVKEVMPRRNRLIVFQVSPRSFHFVQEVLTEDRCRFSLTGWFYYADEESDTQSRIDRTVCADMEAVVRQQHRWEYVFEDKLSCSWSVDYSTQGYCAHLNDADFAKDLKRWLLLKFEACDYYLGSSLNEGAWCTHWPLGSSRIAYGACSSGDSTRPVKCDRGFRVCPSADSNATLYVLLLYTAG